MKNQYPQSMQDTRGKMETLVSIAIALRKEAGAFGLRCPKHILNITRKKYYVKKKFNIFRKFFNFVGNKKSPLSETFQDCTYIQMYQHIQQSDVLIYQS